MPELSLEKISVNGFRGLKNLTLENLGRINLLVGENNSGKTSVLEAISILCTAYEPFEWFAMIRRRDFGGLDETRIQSIRWCFRQTGQLSDPDFVYEGSCDLRCEGRFAVRQLQVTYKDIDGYPDDKELDRINRRRGQGRPQIELEYDEPWRGAEIAHYITDDDVSQPELFKSLSEAEKEPIVVTFWENDPMFGRPHRPRRRGNLRTETLTPYSYQLNRLQVRSHSQQLFGDEKNGERRKERVVDLVREFDPDIMDIRLASFRGDRPAIYVVHRVLGPCPLSIFGDALRRAVLLASTLDELQGGGVLLVDEIETGIHISALERVFSWLVRTAEALKVQVIATTHSLEAVDAVLRATKQEKEEVATFHLEQQPDETQAKRMGQDLLFRLRYERGLDVR